MEKTKKYHQETDIVQFLFGTQVEIGTLISSFASSYNRQQGRFYICSKVLCFYSNTLGFEKKLCIRIPKLISASIRRNTSIVIQCHSDHDDDHNGVMMEEHVFRSFKDRLVVLDWIGKVYHECTGGTLPQYHDRDDQEEQNGIPLDNIQTNPMENESLLQSEEDETEDDIPRETKTTHPSIHLDQIALPPTQFQISLKEYHQRFLADDAPKSMEWFQSNCIGDEIKKCTNWKQRNDDTNCYTRIIHSIHKRNQRVGPSKVSIHRKQSFKWYNFNSIVLETIMTLEGVPYSDCFVVEDEWIIRSIQESCVEVTVRYRIHFVKKTLMKNIIIRQTREEVKKWFDGYLHMLQNELGESNKETNKPVDKEKIHWFLSNGIWKMSTILMWMFGLILLILLSCLTYKVDSLEAEMKRLTQSQRETLKSLHVLQECIEQRILHNVDSTTKSNVCEANNRLVFKL